MDIAEERLGLILNSSIVLLDLHFYVFLQGRYVLYKGVFKRCVLDEMSSVFILQKRPYIVCCVFLFIVSYSLDKKKITILWDEKQN